MLSTFINIFKVPELRNKLLFTISLLAIYRIGFSVPLPGVWQEQMASTQSGGGGLDDAFEYFAIFTGGNLSQSTIFGLGIMPYITSSIIFQLLATVLPALERLKHEGATGYKKIQEYTRYATVPICLISGVLWLRYILNNGWVYPDYARGGWFWLMGLTALVCGTMFLMWLGEQIDEYGIGNGISLIIMAGILARMPTAIVSVWRRASLKISGSSGATLGPQELVFLIVAFVGVIAGSILITQAQRRIPIQQAKQMRGRRVYGGQRNYLPLRVNHGGVMPIIFASSMMMFPSILFNWLNASFGDKVSFFRYAADAFSFDSFVYLVTYILLVYLFSYFWTTVQFQPKEMANQLRDHGSIIPGLRPGPRTAAYLERIMGRITYVGAGFLALIAVIPSVVGSMLNIDFTVTQYLGGTGLLIVVSVALDLVQRIEANLIMRNYQGFLGGEGAIKGARM